MQNETGSRTVVDSGRRRGFLTRLARDVRGNTLAIVGAALVPLSAMIGSGVDMSRAYMAKTRLQSACDAAALAARRIMQQDQMTDEVRAEAVRFFNFNFRQGLYETNTFTPDVTRPSAGTVRITASTRIPTTIMHMFGFETLPLNVTCEASLNFVNTDVMLVLDTTGSMAWDVNGNNTNNAADQKITALRDAVMALYDELAPIQTQLEANGLRLRYGVVPYSSTVNVGYLLRAANPNNLAASADYSTRLANYTTAVNTPTDTPIVTVQPGLAVNPGVQRFQVSGVDRQISNANCTKFGANNGFTQSGTSPVGGTFTATGINNDADVYDPDGAAPFQASAPAAPTGYVRYQFSRNTPTWSGSPTNRVCDRNVVITRRTYTTRFSYTNDTFVTNPVDISGFRTGNSVTMATGANNNNSSDFTGTVAASGSYTMQQLAGVGTGVATQTVTWNGCIMERQTVNTITTASGMTLPANAFDLDINRAATDDASRWRPLLPELSWRRSAGTAAQSSGTAMTAPCPVEARRLTTWNRGNMQSYVNTLDPTGSTYHDVGMIWGARMLSTTGVFGDGCENFNGMPCTRHIIFMTDGQMDTDNGILAFHGIERNDQRVSGMSNPSEAELNGRHMQRFRMVCNAARSMNVTIWVIAFGTTLSSEMIDCAGNNNQASTAANRAQLIARFREIGSNIGALRLTQ